MPRACRLSLGLTILMLCMAGCVTTKISRSKAIALAINECHAPHFILIGEPHNLRTKLLTMKAAYQALGKDQPGVYYSIPQNELVWLVEMDGPMVMENPFPPTQDPGIAATATPVPPSSQTCVIIIDANGGAVLKLGE